MVVAMRSTVKLIDIFNDRYEHIGTEDKKTAHARGSWHRTFSALAVNPTTKRVVLQKKSPGRYSFDRPDYADITVGGHYEAGETIPEGVREVHEELGLPITYADLLPIGLRQTAISLAPDYIEHEFQHWHLLPLDVDLEAIPLADAEVSGLVDLDLDEALALAEGARETVAARYATRSDTGLVYSEGSLTRDDLVPNYLKLDQLYLRLFVAAHRFCAGERTHVFW
jgi:8-oxo-dGTP pyrophosphatase MutT (NUDIX family)